VARRLPATVYDPGVSASSPSAERGPPPKADDEETLAGLRAALQRADFTTEAVEARLGTHELSSRADEVAVHVRRLAGDDAFATLAKAFLLGTEVDAPALGRALEPLELRALAALGLIATDGSRVWARARLVPHGDYYIASDADRAQGPEASYDHVPGIQAPSVTLAKLAVRRRVATALDLGTGCGIQALLAAKHCERVVATDVSGRALGFARFNLRLNGVDNVELRLGDGFEVVGRERFDLIVSNPPYVISPDTAYAYRDSGLEADALCRRIVGSLPDFLAEGGFAHVLVSWAQEPAGDWAEPLRNWVDERGCDAWLLHYKTEDVLTHAANWLRPLGEEDPVSYEQALDRWLEYLRRLEIEAIGYGAVVLRRRSGSRNWVYAERLPLERLEPASEHTLRVFAARDYLEAPADDTELLNGVFELTEHHRLEQTIVSREGGLAVEGQTLALLDGLAFRVGLDRYTAALLPHFDGARPLREVLAQAQKALRLGAAEEEQFEEAALPVARRLLELGFLSGPPSGSGV
jgi:methyltransferase family protein